MATSLLKTKLYAPPLRPNLVSRPHLIQRLDGGLRLGHRLTLISAPAGFGKTTLLSEWVANRESRMANVEPVSDGPQSAIRSLQFCWLSLDEGDNDPTRFWAYVAAALQTARPGTAFPVPTEAVLDNVALMPFQTPRTEQPPAAESVLTAWVNVLAEDAGPLVLMLDDYHAIHAQPIHDALAFFLDHLPPQVHLVLATRADPPLPLARLRARGQLTELRTADLRFTPAEAADFLNRAMGLSLAEADVAALEARTEGWIAGLQLAALSIQGRNPADFIAAFDGSHRYVMDYLFEEVLRRQPEEVREFLLQTSILDRLCAPLCDAVRVSESTGQRVGESLTRSPADSQSVLEYLDRANLFIVPLDDRREWYRYHHLFADFLRAQLQPGRRAELHRRAARWFETHNFLAEVVRHTLATGVVEEAERAILRAAGPTLSLGEVSTLLGWLEALPEEAVRTDFWLAGFKGWVLCIMRRIEAATSYVELAGKNLPPDATPYQRGFLSTLRAYLAYYVHGNWADTIRSSLEALDGIGDVDPVLRSAILVILAHAQYGSGDPAAAAPSFREAYEVGYASRNYFAGLSALSRFAWLQLEQGQWREVVALCQQAIADCVDDRGKPLPVAGYAYVVLGQAYYQANELFRARQCLLTSIELLSNIYDPFYPLWGKVLLAHVHRALGERQAAQETLQDASKIAKQQGWQGLYFAAWEVDFHMRMGNFAAAARLVEVEQASPAHTPEPWQRGIYLMYARLLLAQARPRDAQQVLAALKQLVQRPDGFSGILPAYYLCTPISILALQAAAHQALGRESAALAKLEEAVRLAAPAGERRTILEDGAAVFRLLPRLHHVAPQFVDQLLEDLAVEARRRNASTPAQPLVEPLTTREIEVLRLVAAGLRNQEIADQLVISVATVKRHLSNINGKLGVSHRTQAVARAQELRLL